LLAGILQKRGLLAEAQSAYIVHAATRWIATKQSALAPYIRMHWAPTGELVLSASSMHATQQITLLQAELLLFLQKLENVTVRAIRIVSP
jgi:hypothetical protein